MRPRVRILFKINDEVVVEENRDLFLSQIEEMRWVIVHECECQYDEVYVERIELPQYLSDIDATVYGLMDWKDPQFKTITGIRCKAEGDDFLDLINNENNIEDYLVMS